MSIISETEKNTKAYNAGQDMAFAILKVVCLMYPHKELLCFYDGLLDILMTEEKKRKEVMEDGEALHL